MPENQNSTTVLIIDDERVIRDLASLVLEQRGFTVLTAPDGLSGLRLAQSQHPDLVLLDYMLPGLDGRAVMEEIQRALPDCPVVFFTGRGSERLAVDLMKSGAADYIPKPFNVQELADRIDQVVRIRRIELENRQLLQEKEALLNEIAAWNGELERRVEEKTVALRKAQEDLIQSEKLAALGYLAAGMAHEIRNPLNSIALLAELLQNDDDGRQDLVGRILREVDRVDQILGKLLSVSKQPVSKTEKVSLEAVVQSALDVFRSQTDLGFLQVELNIARNLPPIDADFSELEQVFTNLFANAIHAMPEGGVLRVEARPEDRRIVVRVSDTGSGIPHENITSIFDPFFTTKGSGSGMGLALVRRIVRTYNGHVEVERSDSRGTTFCLRFPAADILVSSNPSFDGEAGDDAGDTAVAAATGYEIDR